MKKLNFLVALCALIICFSCSDDDDDAPEFVVTFEDLNLKADSYWNGSDKSGDSVGVAFPGKPWQATIYETSFKSGEIEFPNRYSGIATGFSYSNKTDMTTAGYLNQYSVYNKSGVDGSKNFALYNQSDLAMKLPTGIKLKGMYLSMGTYGALIVQNGQSGDFAIEKFGENDFYKVSIQSVDKEGKEKAKVDFNLAEGTSFIKDWTWVDLTSLGNVEYLKFTFSSSKTNDYGNLMPAYVFIDNITYTK